MSFLKPNPATRAMRVLLPIIDLRLWILLLPALAYLFTDPPVARSLLYSMVCMLIVAGVTHLMRKVMFPYIDLEIEVVRAHEHPIGAAVVVFGVCLVFASIVLGTVWWIRG